MIKVVVVDDDVDLLEMVCLMLKTPKIVPICIDNGKSVIATLDAIQPDVLIMDIFLGDFDGRNLCEQIKSSQRYSDLPILLYSAGQITQNSLKEAGADDFLKKPFEMSELIEKIETLANRS